MTSNLPIAASRGEAAEHLAARIFAYLPLANLCSNLDGLLRLRGLLGLRSPINTAARLLNPFDAPAGVDGVFHPPYIALHVSTAALLDQGRLVVVKGGGGEAERNPAKPLTAHVYDRKAGQAELSFPTWTAEPGADDLPTTWQTGAGAGAATARATIALALIALNQAHTATAADRQADAIWAARR